MGNAWSTDLRHFEGLFGPDALHAPEARRIAEYFGSIAMAATSWYADIPMPSAIRCRRRPKRRPCPGHINLVRNGKSGVIEWNCSSCDDYGVIDGWQSTMWDLSRPEDEDDPEVDLLLSDTEHRALCGINELDKDSLRVVMSALTARNGEVAMAASLEEMEHLAGYIAAAANAERKRARQQLLDAAGQKIDAAMRRAETSGAVVLPFPGVTAPGAQPKISATLLEFAEPVLEMLDDETPIQAIEDAMQMVVTVWNAIVIEEWGLATGMLEEARRLMQSGVPALAPIFDKLVDRKRKKFGGDLRGVGKVEISRGADGGLLLKAEAHQPSSLGELH